MVPMNLFLMRVAPLKWPKVTRRWSPVKKKCYSEKTVFILKGGTSHKNVRLAKVQTYCSSGYASENLG